jgi:hypothetical protein
MRAKITDRLREFLPAAQGERVAWVLLLVLHVVVIAALLLA